MGSELSRQLTQRFFRYLAITSQSDPKVKTLPLSLIHISEPTRLDARSRMPSSA